MMQAERARDVAVTVYHNPACGTSRKVLARIQAAGIEPMVVEYLKTPTRVTLLELQQRTGLPMRGLLREKGTPCHELGLDAPDATDDDLIEAVLAHPILLNRPIVVTPWGAALCRPPEERDRILPLPRSDAAG
ncbi:arsenate reductase (glutaredoxin) [Chelatococcus sp. SYSU_G07232]|uniref:Arsenate reductase n=1 Tax=Chelatococcus albus TaxID=3047466 RepID=A0ABT7AE14_9HYPH|nr:arsenate reductase (glutaredoxin) [Chelatococcus sp. SYSU_G07232]MDJ1157044.1 arsenate reductase (glutaredoxin) [Chelatococcus sp. SYSU_G07232]